VEYAGPVWANITGFLVDIVEGIQKRALCIVLPHLRYKEALETSGLQSLADRRRELCISLMTSAKELEPLRSVITGGVINNVHGYSLRSGSMNTYKHISVTKRFGDFVTYRFL